MRHPTVGDVVIYSMIRKLYSPVEAIVTATCREDETLNGMQVRLFIHGRKNQHPTGAIDYSFVPCMGSWSWPGDRDRWESER